MSSGNISTSVKFGEYAIERISIANLKDLYILYKAVYGKDLPNGYYEKKYDTAYTGKMFAGFIAYNGSVPIGYYGVIPCLLQYGADTIHAAQSADTMTHSDHRNKGLLAELHRLALELCRGLGIKVLFGFPNQNSYPILKNKFNWEEAEKMDRFELSTDMNLFQRSLRKVPGIRRFHKSNQEKILQQHALPDAGLPNQEIQFGRCGVLRTAEYLEHKKYNKTHVVSVGKSKVWLKAGADLTIGDIEMNGSSFEEVMGHLKTLARQLQTTKIHFQSSPGTELHRLLVNHYPALPSFPVLIKDLGAGLQLDRIKFTFADIDIF